MSGSRLKLPPVKQAENLPPQKATIRLDGDIVVVTRREREAERSFKTSPTTSGIVKYHVEDYVSMMLDRPNPSPARVNVVSSILERLTRNLVARGEERKCCSAEASTLMLAVQGNAPYMARVVHTVKINPAAWDVPFIRRINAANSAALSAYMCHSYRSDYKCSPARLKAGCVHSLKGGGERAKRVIAR
jgi:hypothetical protein